MNTFRVAVIGAGPAGLMAADVLSAAGIGVTIFDRMPSPGRKFLMAGRGGLNLTHSEPLDRFLPRYAGSVDVSEAIKVFPPPALRAFAEKLGQELFVGTSGRVFPRAMKASPLLRAWLARLLDRRVVFRMRENLVGFEGSRPVLANAAGERHVEDVDATVLALGGASWPRLGSNGAWVELLTRAGVGVTPLAPANCGVHIAWSEATKDKFAGAALKRAAFSFENFRVRGEAVLTRDGLEGGAIYALASAMRERLVQGVPATLSIDLLPDLTAEALVKGLRSGRPGDSRANVLRKRLSLGPAALALVRESEGGPPPAELDALAARLKDLRFDVIGVAGLERAISTAGGIRRDALDDGFMLRALPGVFVAGEMLDVDAPTGGYLLQSAFATGSAAGHGVMRWVYQLADRTLRD